MKILKIREGKIKLSLDTEEAASCGLCPRQVISEGDLSCIVRRLLKSEGVCEGWEGLIVEAYPRMDGSYEIFVTGDMPMDKSTRKPSILYFGFSAWEHLAFALYVLARTRSCVRPLCEDSCEEERDTPVNIVDAPLPDKRGSTLPVEVSSLFFGSERKSENPDRELLLTRLPPCQIYRTEELGDGGECYSYILAAEETADEGAELSMLCEFGNPLTKITEEVLSEHASRIGISELFSQR